MQPDALADPRSGGAVAGRRPSMAAIGLASGVAAVVILAALIRPFASGPLAFDATAAVLYFDRIASGTRLEAFVNTTPKPLLTVVFGLAHAITGDWRAVTWTTILAAGTAVGLGTALAWRIAGPGAAFVAFAALALQRSLVVETAWSHGLPWALATWFAAGIALTGDRRRYGIAGLALALGCLARQETFLLLGAATLVTGAGVLRGRLPRRSLLVLLGWAALPAFLLHDLLLTGDPLFWLRVASINAADATSRSLGTVLGMLWGMVAAAPLLFAATIIGLMTLRRSGPGRVVAAGILVAGLGTALLLLVLATLGRQTLYYYLDPIALVATYGAAFGVAAAASWVADRIVARLGPAGATRAGATPGARAVRSTIVALGLLVVLAIVAFVPVGVSRATLTSLRTLRATAAAADAAEPVLAQLVAGDVPIPIAPGHTTRPAAAGLRVLVPHAVQVRLAVDLGLPVTVVGMLVPDRAQAGRIHGRQVVFHARGLDGNNATASLFEGPGPVIVDGVTFELVRAGPGDAWIWRSTDW